MKKLLKTLYFVWCKKDTKMKQSGAKVLTNKIQIKFNQYFSKVGLMSKAEIKALKDMTFGILKSRHIHINKIVCHLQEHIKLKDGAKRLSKQYLKADYWEKVTKSHIESVSPSVKSEDFLIWDGTDISKKYAKHMEGLEYVRDGDKKTTGLGYNVLNVNIVNCYKEIKPIYSKAYSFEMGAKSENSEIKYAANFIKNILGNIGIWVLDRGADRTILKDYFVSMVEQFILRLKRNTTVNYKGEDIRVDKLSKKLKFNQKQIVIKVKKNKRVKETYELAITEIIYTIKNKEYRLHLMITKNQNGGLAYLLVKSTKKHQSEILEQSFKGYGYRWSIEEYHRHIKQEYNLEDIQMRTYVGLQSMLAVITVAMNVIYNELKAIHISLLIDGGMNLFNKNHIWELYNFIYYKISKIVAVLLSNVNLRHKIKYKADLNINQLGLEFDF